MEAAGFFGKLPSHGDFVSRRVPRDFLEVWDRWLQQSISASKATLGDGWLAAYLNSPIWRFALSRGVCGQKAWLGMLVPSVDRVGRYFPLCVVAAVPQRAEPLEIACEAQSWFTEAEHLLLSVLGDDAPELEAFDQAVAALALPAVSVADTEDVRSPAPPEAVTVWETPLTDAASLPGGAARLLGSLLDRSLGSYSAWWTDGSQTVAANLLVTASLPEPARYSTMLTGASPGRLEPPPPHQPVDEEVDGGDTFSLADLIKMPISLTFKSAGRSDVGKVRRVNEDAMLENCSNRLWLVADGMGGHSDGKTASSSIVKAVSRLELSEDMDERVHAVSRALQSVNRELRNYALHHPRSSGLGSTAAVLVANGGTCAVIWAGDTRVYRKRGRALEQLTEDHSERQELIQRGDIASILSPSNVITRAVGGDDVLRLSMIRTSVHPGDRFLLCSDGVYQEIPANDLFMLLEEADRQGACDAIVARVNEGRATDNATALIVDASIV